ncbi:hypothetical protein Acor_57700 [Acrocarpospora corrugata]|uniref:Uncharacterized protein n=1 Tax=Acrocarpospora corrugata TaxID=35763 RepID=A0A5M3W4K8_9ACTN|nr:hypothetical protein [Acrocarpospora corrugata]GES03704.1 hypothetical protein Acor_57700 [Acrocarpospora corrugata]
MRSALSYDGVLQKREYHSRLANAGGRAGEHAQRLIESVVGPATSRLREAGGLRPGITVADIAVFIRMTLTTDSPESRV